MEELNRADMDVELEIQMQTAVLHTHKEQQEVRAKNTSQQYNGKINEWTLWCEQKKFSDGRLVKPNKLLLWLREVVLPRGNRKKRDTEGNPVPLTVEGLEGYIKPIVDLWSQQKLLNILSKDAEHPRSSAIQTLLKSLEKSRDAHRRATFQDKGAGTLLEGYSPEEKAKLVDFWWLQESHHGEHLRNLAGFLLQNATMARGDNVRHMQLSDMWSKELEGEGPSMCIALGITSRQGKTNQVGRIEYTGAIRHREFNFCTIGAIAMYFFWRFQIQKEPPPDVKESRLWYDTFLMKVEEAQSKRRKVKKVQGLSDSLGDLPGCMSYDTQYQAYRKAYAAVGICATKVVHLPRGVAARQM